jgi:hypothetical protein
LQFEPEKPGHEPGFFVSQVSLTAMTYAGNRDRFLPGLPEEDAVIAAAEAKTDPG